MGRPECLLGASIDEEMGGPFYLINMVKFTALLATFGLLLIAQRACACRGALQQRREHRQTQRQIRSGQPVDELERLKRQRRMRRASDRIVDKLEMIESIVFGMQVQRAERANRPSS